MRLLVAGATGVIGRQLVPLLTEAGHDVIALARPGTVVDDDLEVVRADALDRNAVTVAVGRAAPDAIVNLLTAIPARRNPRRFARQMDDEPAANRRHRQSGVSGWSVS